MKQIWNTIQIVFSAFGGFLGWFLGGADGFLYALIAFVVTDYIKCRINTLKVDIVSFIVLFFKVKSASVMPTRVFIRNVWKHNRERISCVQILNMVITMHLNT